MSPVSHDPTLFGTGPYPRSGPLAVLARLAFLAALLAILTAALLPPSVVPNFVYSHHLQHFAAFYVAMLLATAALPYVRLHRLVIGHVAFASLVESHHLLGGAPVADLVDAWCADVGGVTAATAPVLVERFRQRVGRLKR